MHGLSARWIWRWIAVALLLVLAAPAVLAHPLGNFTINHFSHLEVRPGEARVHFVVDMAEIAAAQELQRIRPGGETPDATQLERYAREMAAAHAAKLRLTLDGQPLPLEPLTSGVTLPAGNGGLPTLRLECDYRVALPQKQGRLALTDETYPQRIGWREMVATGTAGVAVYNGTGYGTSATRELRTYPEDMLSAPLDERKIELSFAKGSLPAGGKAILSRSGQPLRPAVSDPLAELIAVRELTPLTMLAGLALAFVLGAGHAFSPGHGKTVVGAYLVGSRGTPRHALFLGVTVTVTHTLGVFALGLVTLFAANSFPPERVFPVLTLLSGGIILGMGTVLFFQRLGSLSTAGADSHGHGHSHDHGHTHDGLTHSHGGAAHSHLPPGADGTPVTWKSLLALGISGGLLPCPSALLVLLAAIALQRVAYGLALVTSFSAGLAATLTAIGLAFLYAGNALKERKFFTWRILRVAPVLSALVIAVAGGAICLGALREILQATR